MTSNDSDLAPYVALYSSISLPVFFCNKIKIYLIVMCLYADDLAVIAETEEELIKRLNEWKENVESKGM